MPPRPVRHPLLLPLLFSRSFDLLGLEAGDLNEFDRLFDFAIDDGGEFLGRAGLRFEALPGITGPWQVSGRNAILDFEEVVRLEASYLRGWTVWRDFVIMLRTVPVVLSMKGAF